MNKPTIDLNQACKRAAQLIRERGLAKAIFAVYTGTAEVSFHEQALGCGEEVALAAQGNYAMCALGGLAVAIHEQDPSFNLFPSLDDAAWPPALEALACTLSEELPPAEESELTDYGSNECLAQLVALNDRPETTAEIVAAKLDRMAEAAPRACC